VPTVFTKNRDPTAGKGGGAQVSRRALNQQGQVRVLLSDEHFSVDGHAIAAWASMKSFQAKDDSSEPPSPGRNGGTRFSNGEKRTNETHASITDTRPSSIARAKAREAKLSFMGNAMTENPPGCGGPSSAKASGTIEREAAKTMVVRVRGSRRITLGRQGLRRA